MKLIDKNKVDEILINLWKDDDGYSLEHRICYNTALQNVQYAIDTLEVKEGVYERGVSNEKTKWSPSKKQMESLKDMLKYNIGVFDYQKFMEVNSLYNDLMQL